jgi:DNA (cytosine-5)-methyltransferase 1
MPNQHRTPSIRELARAQGFPDGIRFQGSPAEKLTQIGNAVPIPLAFALGESIVDAMVTDFLRGDRRFAKQRVV